MWETTTIPVQTRNRKGAGHAQRNRSYSRRQHNARPWLCIDGEGYTRDAQHLYYEFSCLSSVAKEPHVISDVDGLNGWRVIRWLIECKLLYPDHIAIIYGGSYDFNMWLSTMGLSREILERIYNGQATRIGNYRIKWMKGKNFQVTDRQRKVTVTVYDVLPFFQTTFVKACDSYLGERFIDRANIVESKKRRGDFTAEELEAVVAYNTSELLNLALLATELRERLNKVGLYPSRWDGPGAIAAYLFKREGVDKALAKTPENVQIAARYAYSGGRFEVIKFGHITERCYEYDINSAYPTALCDVPNLQDGEWEHVIGPDAGKEYPFALYHIKWNIQRDKGNANIPGPLFRRLRTGNVHYPLAGEGWYWTPEYLSSKVYAEKVGGTFTISEAWIFHSGSRDKPFGFVPALYAERRELKKAKDGAHVGLKLALNSMYGKLAQQVGWRIIETERGQTLKLPPFHQLEWAGYVTSHCRATVLKAALTDIDSVIAFETDALFTTRPLKLDTGEDLGQFEVTEFLDLTYMQSGTYYGRAIDSKTGEVKELTAKTRGIDRGSLSREECLTLMDEPIASKRKVHVVNRRFYTLGLALMQDMTKWTQWLEVPKDVTLEPTGKRFHDPTCPCSKEGIAKGVWHDTICPTVTMEHSYEFPVEWVKPTATAELFRIIREDADMLELDTLTLEPLE